MMELTCGCRKVLHADECGFHNENYKDVLLFLCPYCGAKTLAFLSLTPDETPNVREITPGLEFAPRRLEPDVEDRFKQFVFKMAQKNNVRTGECLGPS
jgi:hypothetical protein